MNVTFKVKIKGCSTVFIEGEEAGVIAAKTMFYDVEEKDVTKGGIKYYSFAKELMDRKQEIIDEHVEVQITGD